MVAQLAQALAAPLPNHLPAMAPGSRQEDSHSAGVPDLSPAWSWLLGPSAE